MKYRIYEIIPRKKIGYSSGKTLSEEESEEILLNIHKEGFRHGLSWNHHIESGLPLNEEHSWEEIKKTL